MKRITSGNWILIDTNGQPVHEGQKVQDFRGDTHTIKGGRPPHTPASTGRVWFVETTQELYPSVVDLKWVESEEYEAIHEREAHQ